MDSDDVRRRLPESHRKAAVFGVIGAAVGAGVGGAIAWAGGNYWFAGIGAGVGAVIGNVLGYLFGGHISFEVLRHIENRSLLALGLLAMMMAMAGIVGFLRTGRWIGVAGAIVFGLAGLYALNESTRPR